MSAWFWAGIESKYPLCCILFFCNVWVPIRQEHRMFSGRPECYDYHSNAGYIQCPECIIKKLINFKRLFCNPYFLNLNGDLKEYWEFNHD